MEPFAVGEIVLIAFPYSNLTEFKTRPALIVGLAEFGNLITCQITSKSYSSKKAILLEVTEFKAGGLKIKSYIRPDKLFTIDPTVVQSSLGVISDKKIKLVQQNLLKIIGGM